MTYPPGQQLFAGPDDEYTIMKAKEWIWNEGYKSEQVKLVKREGRVLVVWK